MGSGTEAAERESDAAFQTLFPIYPQNSLAQSPSGRTASPWKCFFFNLSIWTAPRFTSRSSSEGKNPMSPHSPGWGQNAQRSLTRGDKEVPPLEWFIQSVKGEAQSPPFPSHSHLRKWSRVSVHLFLIRGKWRKIIYTCEGYGLHLHLNQTPWISHPHEQMVWGGGRVACNMS